MNIRGKNILIVLPLIITPLLLTGVISALSARNGITAVATGFLQFKSEQLAIPTGVLGEPVVSENIGALLRRGHILNADRGYAIDLEEPRRLQPAMARDNAAISVNQDRIRPAKESDRIRDLAELLLRMCARVAGVRLQGGNRQGLYLQITENGRVAHLIVRVKILQSQLQDVRRRLGKGNTLP